MSDTEILEDIEWINLTKTAKKNWGKLKEILNVEMELDYVNVLENNFANAT
jgi:hypothetical protein